MSESFEVRDGRAKTMFRVDDEYLNGYSRLCGANATLVYLCLCRHADRNQESFPSVATMAEKTGISRDSIMRGIKSLIEWNIISKERERRDNATWLNNRYVLLDKSVWNPKPSSSQQHGAKSHTATSQVANEGGSQVAHSDTKVSHKKEAHVKDSIAEEPRREAKLNEDEGRYVANGTGAVLDAFRHINPSTSVILRKAQSTAALRLIETHGLETVLNVIGLLKQTNAQPYFTPITTPIELEAGWAKLQAKVSQKRIEITTPKTRGRGIEL